MTQRRLTGYAHGGGCACKIPPGELEEAVRGLLGQSGENVLVGLDDGDDAAARRVGQEPQGAVNVRLAAAVRSGNHIERSQRNHEIPQGSIVCDGEGLQQGRVRRQGRAIGGAP